MVTSCYRRMGNYVKAAELYKDIHKEFPQNIECLRYLVALCRDMDTPYEQYQIELSKLERANIQHTMTAGAGRTFAGFGGVPAGGMSGGRNNAAAATKQAPGARFSSFAEGESSVDESMEVSANLSESEAASPARSGRRAAAPAPAPAPTPTPTPAPAATGGGGGASPPKAAKETKEKKADSDDDWAISDDELPGFGDD